MENEIVAVTVIASCDVMIDSYRAKANDSLATATLRIVYERFIGELKVLRHLTRSVMDALERESCADASDA